MNGVISSINVEPIPQKKKKTAIRRLSWLFENSVVSVRLDDEIVLLDNETGILDEEIEILDEEIGILRARITR